MTNTSKITKTSGKTKLVFFGNERLVSGLPATNTPILRALIEQGYAIEAVIVSHTETNSRNKRPLEVAELAEQYGIPVHAPARLSDFTDELQSFGAEAAVLVAYGKIIPQRVIDLFPGGIINIHPSLLPAYRGPTPLEAAIAARDNQTGVSIMQLTAGMDEGPVYAQEIIALDGTETKFDLYGKVIATSTQLLTQVLPDILSGKLQAVPQSGEPTYSQLLTKADSLIDPSSLTAPEAEARIRAHLGFPKSKIALDKQLVIVTKAHVTKEADSPLDIPCHGGSVLAIDELIAPSGKAMSAAAYINGYMNNK